MGKNNLVIKNFHQERSCSGRVCGLIDGEVVSSIEYSGWPKKKCVHIGTVYTRKEFRGKGYASQLLEYFIGKNGDKMDIILSCHPYERDPIENNIIFKTHKERQEKMAKWYSKFGFVTKRKDELHTTYEWVMVRNKKQ